MMPPAPSSRHRSEPGSRAPATLGLVLLAAAALAGCGRTRPNLVLITLDTTRADHLGAYGYAGAKTPTIDGLAREGFLFRRHLTPVPITLPAHTSLMTGLFPPVHTVRDNGTFYVPPSALTLAEVLQKAGYDTAAFVASFPLEKRFGLDQGFAHYDDRFYRDERDRARRDIEGLFFDERPARDVVDAALAYLEGRQQRPFFVWLHFFDPHQPQQPPAPFDIEFRDRPYDGEIAYVDSQLARFLAFLSARGDRERTVVALTADHGEGLGDHGELSHAILLHQATLHIPLVLAGPGVPQGETTAWTSATSVLATLLDLLHLPVPSSEQTGFGKPVGASLAPLLANGGQLPADGPPFTAYFETIAPRTSQGWSQLTGWMQGDLRYIYGPSPALYDLAADPRESRDLVASRPESAGRLRYELSRYLAANETRRAGQAAQAVDAETVARLAALGYLQTSLDDLAKVDDMLAVEGLPDPRQRVIDISAFSEAKAAMAKQRWSVAEGLWKGLLRRSPEHVFAYRGLAVIYAAAHDWDRCFAILDEGIAKVASSNDLRRLKGELLIENGRYAEGLDVLTAMSEESVEAATWLGIAYQGVGDGERAKQAWRAGLDLDPENRWLHLYLANQLASERDFATAEATYRELLRAAPYFPLAYYNYGRMLIDAGRRAEARPILERAAALSPQHAATRAALAELEAGGGTP